MLKRSGELRRPLSLRRRIEVREGAKMRQKSILMTIVFVLSLSLAASSAYWESSTIEIGSISPNTPTEFGRLLFKFDLPEQMDGATIDYAVLLFTATPDTGSSYICLMGAFPVTKSWASATLFWTEGWTKSGGDYADTIYCTGVIRTSTDELSWMDITDIVQMWADTTLTNYGVMVMPLEDSDRFLKLHDTPGLPPTAKAKVRIYYTPVAEE
jgi:hypothetical protein